MLSSGRWKNGLHIEDMSYLSIKGTFKSSCLEFSYFSSVVENFIDRVASFKLLHKQTKGGCSVVSCKIFSLLSYLS